MSTKRNYPRSGATYPREGPVAFWATLVSGTVIPKPTAREPAKQLCEKDTGPTSILGVPTGVARDALTQGCLPVSVYDPLPDTG